MNVPDVVQAFRRITEFRAVLASPIQFWLAVKPEQLEDRVQPERARGPR